MEWITAGCGAVAGLWVIRVLLHQVRALLMDVGAVVRAWRELLSVVRIQGLPPGVVVHGSPVGGVNAGTVGLPPFKENLKLMMLVSRGAVLSWAIKVTDEYAEWFRQLIKENLGSASQVAQAVAALRDAGPTLGRPLVDRLKGSELHHLKELRPGSGGRSEIRIIFAFDPTRSALLLLGGDKAGNWERWYRDNVPLAEQLYRDYTGDTED
jgi:hypothetical protein